MTDDPRRVLRHAHFVADVLCIVVLRIHDGEADLDGVARAGLEFRIDGYGVGSVGHVWRKSAQHYAKSAPGQFVIVQSNATT